MEEWRCRRSHSEEERQNGVWRIGRDGLGGGFRF